MKFFKILAITVLCFICGSNARDIRNCVVVTRSATSKTTINDAQVTYAMNIAQLKNKSCVYLDRGAWRFSGTLTVPSGITLMGNIDINHNVTKNDSIYGSSIECRHGAGLDADAYAQSCVLLNPGANIDGFNLYWPNNIHVVESNGKVHPANTYPWGITCLSNELNPTKGCSIRNTTLGNAYNGILFLNTSNNEVFNVNIGAYRAGIKFANTNNGGIVKNVNVHDMYIWDTDTIPLAKPESITELNPVIDSLEVYTYQHLVGFETNNATNITVTGMFTYRNLYGFYISNDQTNAGSTISLINSGCDLCNNSLVIGHTNANDTINVVNSQLFGKVNVYAEANKNVINIQNTQMSYYVTKNEANPGRIPHIWVQNPETVMYIKNGDITTAGVVGDYPFYSAVVWTAGIVHLLNVNMVSPYLYADWYQSDIPVISKFVEWFNSKYTNHFDPGAYHAEVVGDNAMLTWSNGFLLGYNSFRPHYCTSSNQCYTSGSTLTDHIMVTLVKPLGQWTSDQVEAACKKKAPSVFKALCTDSMNDPDYRYKPLQEDEVP